MLPHESGPDKDIPSHADIVFEASPDRPRPRLPRVADGVRFLTLDQAAAKYKVPRQTLLNEWLATFSSLDLTRDEPPSAAPVNPGRIKTQEPAPRRRPRVRLPRELLDQVDALASRVGFPRSELLRFWIREGVARAGRGNA